MNLALEVDRIEDVGDEILAFIEPELPKTLVAKIKMLPRLKQLADFIPKTVKTGPCKDVIETTAPSLDPLPVLQCWPEDAGRFITFPLVFTRNPRTGRRNCGMYRMQVYDSRTTGMHWQIHKHGAKHYQDSERAGEADRRRRRDRDGPRRDVRRDGADAGRRGRDDVRGIPPQGAGRDGEVRDRGPGGPGEQRDRPGRILRPRRAPDRGGRSAITRGTTRWRIRIPFST